MDKRKPNSPTHFIAPPRQSTRSRKPWIFAAVIAGTVFVVALVVTARIRSVVSPASQDREKEVQEPSRRLLPLEEKLVEPHSVDVHPVEDDSDNEPIDQFVARLERESAAGERVELPIVGKQDSWAEMDDPIKDGWDTEAFSAQANQQLKQIGKLIAGTDKVEQQRIAALIVPGFDCDALLPVNLDTVFEDQDVKVERSSPRLNASPSKRTSNPGSQYREGEGFLQAMRSAARPFQDARDVRFKFKIFRVESLPKSALTRQYFSVSGRTAAGILEQHATWITHWSPAEAGQPPRLQSIQVEDFEQVTSRRPGDALFADCTESVLGKNPSYRQQFLRGFNHWLNRIQESRYLALLANPGISVGDVNGDGLDDLYVCQETGLPNRLFIQQQDGSARDESEPYDVNWLEASRSALLVDLDNDSDQDLVVAVLGGVAVAENDSSGVFRLRDVVATTEDTMSLAAADYDQDGRLDLYVCAYYPNELLLSERPSDTAGVPGVAADTVLHDARNGGTNSLLRNEISVDGVWRFRDVTSEVGLDVGNYRHSFAAVWEDYDNDGDQDLYVANDFGPNNLYRNDHLENGTREFVEVSAEAGAEDRAFGMSVSWGDFNRDGWMDLYVGNMFSAAGNRITFQTRFKPDAESATRERFQYLARGNTLLQNDARGRFIDVTATASVLMGRWSWGSMFVDMNNDGWEDLIATNGFITNDENGDL